MKHPLAFQIVPLTWGECCQCERTALTVVYDTGTTATFELLNLPAVHSEHHVLLKNRHSLMPSSCHSMSLTRWVVRDDVLLIHAAHMRVCTLPGMLTLVLRLLL